MQLPRSFLVRSLLLDSLSSKLERSSLSWFGFFLLLVAEKISSGVSSASTELFRGTAPPPTAPPPPPAPPTFLSMTVPPFLGPLPLPLFVLCKLSRMESAMLIFCKLSKGRSVVRIQRMKGLSILFRVVPVPDLPLLQLLVDVGRQPMRGLGGRGGAPYRGQIAHALTRGQRPWRKLWRVWMASVVLSHIFLLKNEILMTKCLDYTSKSNILVRGTASYAIIGSKTG